MRVAFVSSHAKPGGSERYLELLLAQLGSEWVAGVVCLQEGPLVATLRAAGHRVEVVETPARAGMLPAAWRLRGALRALEPDVIHANGVKAALVAGLATRGTSLPVVWVKHDFSWDGWLAQLVARMSAEVVGVSGPVVEGLRARTAVVPNGLPELRADAVRGRAVLGDGEHVVLLGRISRVKGQLELVEATPALLERRPAAQVWLVGGEDADEPEYAHELRQRVAALGLGERVHLVGHREDALDLVAGADVAAVASGPNGTRLRGEGFGLAALEAMRLGTPVVGWRAGALPEVVADAAVLVAPGDRPALADAIARVLADGDLRARLTAAGRARAATFTLERVAAAMGERYAAAADGRGGT